MPDAPVIIVGGGAAGLSSAGALAHRGIDAVVLEQDPELGGTWARRYDRLHLHTIRGFSGLAHFAIPRRYPRYLSRDQMVAYLKEYAATSACGSIWEQPLARSASDGIAARMDGCRRRRCDVACARRRDCHGSGRTAGRASMARPRVISRTADPLGRVRENGAPFAGQRVLVVGAGNSGAEIATDVADSGAASVAIAVRTPRRSCRGIRSGYRFSGRAC